MNANYLQTQIVQVQFYRVVYRDRLLKRKDITNSLNQLNGLVRASTRMLGFILIIIRDFQLARTGFWFRFDDDGFV